MHTTIQSRVEKWLGHATRRVVLRTGVAAGFVVSLVATVTAALLVALGMIGVWVAVGLVFLVTLIAVWIASLARRRVLLGVGARLQLLDRLDKATGSGEALLTVLTAKSGAETSAVEANLLHMAAQTAMRALTADAEARALPAWPRRAMWAIGVVLSLCIGGAVTVHLLTEDSALPLVVASQTPQLPGTGGMDSEDPTRKPSSTEPSTSGRVLGAGTDSGPNDDTAEGHASGGELEGLGREGSDANEDGAQDSVANKDRPRAPRTSEPRSLAPNRTGVGANPEIVGDQSTPGSVATPARLPWERPTEVPGVAARREVPEKAAEQVGGHETGERRRPPMRRPTSQKPEDKSAYVKQPLKIIPEVRDGDRKAIPVIREVYSPGEANAETLGPSAPDSQEGGKAAMAVAPIRGVAMPSTALTDSERAWLDGWLKRFGGN